LVNEQHFQRVEGAVRAGDRREVLKDVKLSGASFTFLLEITLDGLGLVSHQFSGKVEGDEIRGTVIVTPLKQASATLQWRARRVGRSDYFAHTGTAMFEAPATDR
jgi:hypothetical protein